MASQSNKRPVRSPTSQEKGPAKKAVRNSKTGKVSFNNTGEGTEECICPVCLDKITDEHDAIYCEGGCDGWLHRSCAGLSKVLFDVWRDCDDPFFCPHCRISKQEEVLSSMQTTIHLLLQDVESLKSKIPESLQPNTPSEPSVASTHGPSQQTQQSNVIQQNNSSDRKFNLVIQGIPECSPNTKRLERLQSDLTNVLRELSSLDNSIGSGCVKDTFRLGKYKSDSNRPRPILVKLLRSSDVQSILSNRRLLKSSISIKPDLSLEERNNEKILLAERWQLLQRGVDQKTIKIRGNNLFISNKLHGKVAEGRFCILNNPTLVSPQPATTVTDSAQSTTMDTGDQPTTLPPKQ